MYVRYDYFSNPFVVRFFKKLKKNDVKIFIEIPTYPYDGELKKAPKYALPLVYMERLTRKKMAQYVDKIITFSDDNYIWNRPTIKITNGVDFEQIKLKRQLHKDSKSLNLIGVATLTYWHGFDRIIKGLNDYYLSDFKIIINFDIVGFGAELSNLKKLVEMYHLEKYVKFHGPKFGEDLDTLFDYSDLAIGSLACHRIGNINVKPLKSAEYAARGIAFVHALNDSRFEDKHYAYKIKSDETPVNMYDIIRFYDNQNDTPIEIRNSVINELSWTQQMKIVVDNIK